ncbi:MAG: hypothetical protein KAQ65_03710 [Candidatus Thorarchaeota archaeon]|nr:hypothetical protein [Candidatus Thorarchaeota archaeon]
MSMKVMFVTGSGGHTKRIIQLSKQISAEKVFVVPYESTLTKKKIGSNYISVLSPRYKAKSNIILTIIRTLFLFLHSLFILIITKPNVAISTGSGLTYPIFMMAKLLRIKTVYIESPSRVYAPSKAGMLLLGKVDLWLSSWPELARRYDGVEYMGLIA